MIYDALASWNEMWYKIGQFFLAPDEVGVSYLARIGISVLIIVVGWLLIKLIMLIIKHALGMNKRGPNIDVSAKFFVVSLIKFFLWILVAFLVIATLKIEVTGLAGITSAVTVALGLALQDLIACFASGVIILRQKHIITGDYISVQNSYGSCEGTVQKIHFFFTYLRTPDGQEVTVPNNNMLKAVVTNYTRLGKRRVNFEVGLSYDVDVEKAKAALFALIKDDPMVLKDETCEVYVYELGQYSVGFRIRCWTSFDDYWPFYNSLAEKVLVACRANNLYIPSITDRTITNN